MISWPRESWRFKAVPPAKAAATALFTSATEELVSNIRSAEIFATEMRTWVVAPESIFFVLISLSYRQIEQRDLPEIAAISPELIASRERES